MPTDDNMHEIHFKRMILKILEVEQMNSKTGAKRPSEMKDIIREIIKDEARKNY